MTEKVNVIEDPTIVALASLRGLQVAPFRKTPTRIAWHVTGDIEALLQDITENTAVPLGDYLRHLKAVRSIMFSLKNADRRENDE